jgi:hypothetical protein
MSFTTFSKFLSETDLTAALESAGFIENLVEQKDSSDWTEPLTAEQLLEAIDRDSALQEM